MKYLEKILPSPHILFIFLVAFSYYFFNQMPLFHDPDAPWHLAAGKEIYELGHIPLYDSWSFTSAGQKWYNISWFFDLGIFLIFKYFGYYGLYLFTSIVGASIVSIIALLLKKEKFDFEIINICTFLIGLALIQFLALRPQLVSFIIIPIYFYIISQFCKQKSKLILLTPFLMLIWVNNHGGFLAGFSFFAIYILTNIRSKNYVLVKQLIFFCGLNLLCLMINPYGFQIIEAILRTLDSVITDYITEWKPFDFSLYFGLNIFILVFLLSLHKSQQILLTERTIIYLWFVAGLLSVRNFSVFILISLFFLAESLSELLPRNQKRKEDIFDTHHKSFTTIICISIFLFICYNPGNFLIKEKEFLGFNDSLVESVDFVEKNYPEQRWLNHYGDGGILIYLGAKKIFADGRAGTAYPEESLKDYLKFFLLEENWQIILAKYQVTGLIINNNQKYHLEAAKNLPDFKLVFTNKSNSIFIKE